MKIPGVKTSKALSRWVKARLLGGAMILGYHRVANMDSDEYDVCVSPEYFAEQMDVIRKYAHPIRLSQLVGHLKNNSLPAKSVAVTFDDGYADNLYQAKPVLEKYGIPATIFVCTGFPGKEFWWDELERLILYTDADLHELNQELEEGPLKWSPPSMHLEMDSSGDKANRKAFNRLLYQFLLPLDVEAREALMKVTRRWSGVSLPMEVIAHRALNHAELLQLTEGGLIELGSHTRSHPMLPHLSSKRQEDEIRSGKQDLESLLGMRVSGFAYPNGRATDDAKRIVRDTGFEYACTSLHDTVRPGRDLLALTRFWQQDIDGERFMRSLNIWMKI